MSIDPAVAKSIERHYRRLGGPISIQAAAAGSSDKKTHSLAREMGVNSVYVQAMKEGGSPKMRRLPFSRSGFALTMCQSQGECQGWMVTCKLPVSQVTPGSLVRLQKAWSMLNWQRVKEMAYIEYFEALRKDVAPLWRPEQMVRHKFREPSSFLQDPMPNGVSFVRMCGDLFSTKISLNHYIPSLLSVKKRRRSHSNYPHFSVIPNSTYHRNYRWTCRYTYFPNTTSGSCYNFSCDMGKEKNRHSLSEIIIAIEWFSEFIFNCMRAGIITGPVTIKVVPKISKESLLDGDARMILIRLSLSGSKAGVAHVFNTDDLLGASDQFMASLTKTIAHPCTTDQALEYYIGRELGIFPQTAIDPWAEAARVSSQGEALKLRASVVEPLGMTKKP